jgi:transposase
MSRHVTLHPHLPVDDLERRYRAAKEPHERTWWQILWLLGRGLTAKAVAESTGYSAYWIGQIAKRYNTGGPEAMRNARHTTSRRQPALLSPELREELRQALAGPAPEDDRWSGRTVAEWMSAKLGRPVSRYRGWVYLNQLKPPPRHGVPRPRHALADPAAQEAFKKTFDRL